MQAKHIHRRNHIHSDHWVSDSCRNHDTMSTRRSNQTASNDYNDVIARRNYQTHHISYALDGALSIHNHSERYYCGQSRGLFSHELSKEEWNKRKPRFLRSTCHCGDTF